MTNSCAKLWELVRQTLKTGQSMAGAMRCRQLEKMPHWLLCYLGTVQVMMVMEMMMQEKDREKLQG